MTPQPERTPLSSAIRFAKGTGTNMDAGILDIYRKPGDYPIATAARILAEEFGRVQASDDHARQLLRRWCDWARAHGHDTGILDDTRAFLFPKP